MNKVILMGRIGKDPEHRNFDSGSELVSFSLATSESRKNKEGERVEETEWHNVTFWGKSASVISKYLKKGDQILIEGSIKYREYEVDGQKRYATDINGRSFHFVGGGSKSDGNQEQKPLPPKPSFNSSQPNTPNQTQEKTDDLPF